MRARAAWLLVWRSRASGWWRPEGEPGGGCAERARLRSSHERASANVLSIDDGSPGNRRSAVLVKRAL